MYFSQSVTDLVTDLVTEQIIEMLSHLKIADQIGFDGMNWIEEDVELKRVQNMTMEDTKFLAGAEIPGTHIFLVLIMKML